MLYEVRMERGPSGSRAGLAVAADTEGDRLRFSRGRRGEGPPSWLATLGSPITPSLLRADVFLWGCNPNSFGAIGFGHGTTLLQLNNSEFIFRIVYRLFTITHWFLICTRIDLWLQYGIGRNWHAHSRSIIENRLLVNSPH